MTKHQDTSSVESAVSIIIPCYKMGEFLPEALASVESQTFPSWELIMVDDAGPEDGTKGIFEDFARRNPERRAVFLRHEHNMGVSAARNSAIAAAQGEYLAFLDPDDIWMDGYLARMVGVLREDPGVSVVNARLALFGELRGERLSDDRAVKLWPWEIANFPASLAVTNFIAPSATVLRKEAMDKAGLFDTAKEIQHAEDYDLWIRLVEAGCRFVLLNEVLVRYRKHAGAASDDPERMRRLERVIVQKHGLFMNLALRRLVQNMHCRHEGLDDLVKNPLKRLWKKWVS
ncbi:MAG: glycosyltransferase [Chthoniobacterales bacterium]|nr:glycosyltransferase [Chthoniobacterales bacterium]